MPKAPGQSDFIYEAPPVDPNAADHGAGEISTRMIYWMMAALFVALFALVAIGLHIPAE